MCDFEGLNCSLLVNCALKKHALSDGVATWDGSPPQIAHKSRQDYNTDSVHSSHNQMCEKFSRTYLGRLEQGGV